MQISIVKVFVPFVKTIGEKFLSINYLGMLKKWRNENNGVEGCLFDKINASKMAMNIFRRKTC